MNCVGKVENGVIRLPAGLRLPEGAEVLLIVPDSEDRGSFADRYKDYIGAADDLPNDLAENLDGYVHGRPKP